MQSCFPLARELGWKTAEPVAHPQPAGRAHLGLLFSAGHVLFDTCKLPWSYTSQHLRLNFRAQASHFKEESDQGTGGIRDVSYDVQGLSDGEKWPLGTLLSLSDSC